MVEIGRECGSACPALPRTVSSGPRHALWELEEALAPFFLSSYMEPFSVGKSCWTQRQAQSSGEPCTDY